MSQLGVRANHVPVWNIILKRLIPGSIQHQAFDKKQLISRIFEVRSSLDVLVAKERGFYSHSVVWGHIMQTLLHRESDLYFSAAATLCKQLGVAYAPTRWYVHLGKSLYTTKLISPYLDILKVTHDLYVKHPSKHKKEYMIITDSILITVQSAKKDGVNIDDLLGDVFSLAWNRGMLFPRTIKEAVVAATRDNSIGKHIQLTPSLEDSLEGMYGK